MKKDDFNGKTVAVVGNSDAIYSREDGRIIDQHDIVIRFNSNFPTRRNSKHLGSRTTHMSLVIRNGYEAMIDSRPDIEFYVPITIGELPKPMRGLPKLPAGIANRFKEYFGGEQVRPTSGAMILTYLLNECKCECISVFGFDGLKTGRHWHGHDGDAERRMLKHINGLARASVAQYGRRKIIGLGLPKTGTTSLQHALAAAGYSVKHGPYDISLMPPERHREELDKYDAILEVAGLFPLEQLVEWYPDAIFINTVREIEPWFESCRKQFKRSRSQSVRRGRMKRFGVNRYDRNAFDKFHGRHLIEVARLEDLGVNIHIMDIIHGDGYEFLNNLDGLVGKFDSMVGKPFPHKRKSK